MTKKSKRGNTDSPAFDEWWDKRGLSGDQSRHPLYRDDRPHPLHRPNTLGHPLRLPYIRLYRLGADLNMIDGMLCCFADWKVFKKRRGKSSTKKLPAPTAPSQGQSKSRASLAADLLFQGRPLRDANHIKLDVATRLIADAVIERPDMFRDEANRMFLCESVADRLADFELRPQQVSKADKEAQIKDVKHAMEGLRSKGCNEYGVAVFEFSLIADILNSHERGEEADPWGTLFLVSITTYLTGTINKPHHAIANQLLKAVGGEAAKSPASARARVSTFKKDYPQWLSVLKGLMLHPAPSAR